MCADSHKMATLATTVAPRPIRSVGTGWVILFTLRFPCPIGGSAVLRVVQNDGYVLINISRENLCFISFVINLWQFCLREGEFTQVHTVGADGPMLDADTDLGTSR